jgi:hypothetical protein
MKNFDELEQLKSKLEYKASLPDASFEFKLKSKLLKKNATKSIGEKLSAIINGYSFNYGLAFNLLVVIMMLGVGIYATLNLGFNNSTPQPAQSRLYSSDPVKQNILNNVIRNNPMILIQNTTQVVSPESQTSEALSMNTTIKEITDNNLIYRIVMTSELGPQSSLCIDALKQPKKIDLVNYVSNDGIDFYYKSIATDNDNNVLNYYLSDNTSQVYYMGGDNALKYNSPTTETPKPEDVLKNTLVIGAITNIETKTNTDNVQYIQIDQMEENKMCTLNDNVGPIISTIQIDPITFKILSKSYYIESISDKNLIMTYSFETYTYEPTEQILMDEFNYNLGYPLMEIGSTNQ